MDPNKVKIFACGPSIYQRPHIGNYRTFIYEDILIKYLEYLGYKVKHSSILTDIEDKAISEAAKKNRKVSDLTDNAADIFFKEASLLKIKIPSPMPRSSTSIKHSAFLIKQLMDKGFAYRYKNDIFFDPLKYKEFGKLFRLDMKRWPKKKTRFKRDTYTGRRWNLGDFILWHGYREGDTAAWDTEIGKGRPAWNIQDPAVIIQNLGNSIDINCGGIDNIYRHHDYTIAIMESISGKSYANYYLHGEHLIANGKSMSKSRGNILYPEDMLKNKYQPYHLRFFLLHKHYRKKLNLTDEKYNKSSEYIDAIRLLVQNLIKQDNKCKKSGGKSKELILRIKEEFEKHMNDDLSLGTAIDSIFLLLKDLKSEKDNAGLDSKQSVMIEKYLRKIDLVLGVIF
jgi:cysteinyl-tRNA synthetase